MNRPTRSKLSERRREVANDALQGWTQAAIARQMHIPQATVSRDLAAMREFWREFPVYDFHILLRKKADFAQRAVLWSNQAYPRRASEFSAVFEWLERQSDSWCTRRVRRLKCGPGLGNWRRHVAGSELVEC